MQKHVAPSIALAEWKTPVPFGQNRDGTATALSRGFRHRESPVPQKDKKE